MHPLTVETGLCAAAIGGVVGWSMAWPFPAWAGALVSTPASFVTTLLALWVLRLDAR